MQNSIYDGIVYYLDDKLYMENICIEDLVKNYNGPAFIYSKQRLVNNIESIRNAFYQRYPNCSIHFAYKACYIPGILRIIKENQIAAEVCSSYEFEMAKKNGLSNNVVWNSPGKTEDEMKNLLENKIHWNVDSLEEAIRINNLAKAHDRCIDIGIRINPDISDLHSKIEAGGKLGVDVASGQAYLVCQEIKKMSNVRLAGLHCHISVENTTPTNHVKALKGLVAFAEKLYNNLGIELDYISPGGGFGSRNHMKSAGNTIDDFAEAMCPIIKELKYQPKLILEPGRYLVDDAAICIGKILCEKECGSEIWWITDMGTNILMPFFGREYDVLPIKRHGRDMVTVQIGDRTSSFAGIIKRNAQIEQQNVEDYIVALNCGSYSFSCVQNYMYPMTCEFFIVDKDKVDLLYKQKTEEQYINELYQ